MPSYEGYKPKFKIGDIIYGFPLDDLVKGEVVDLTCNHTYRIYFHNVCWPDFQDAAWIDEQFDTDPEVAYHKTIERSWERQLQDVKAIRKAHKSKMARLADSYLKHFGAPKPGEDEGNESA